MGMFDEYIPDPPLRCTVHSITVLPGMQPPRAVGILALGYAREAIRGLETRQ